MIAMKACYKKFILICHQDNYITDIEIRAVFIRLTEPKPTGFGGLIVFGKNQYNTALIIVFTPNLLISHVYCGLSRQE